MNDLSLSEMNLKPLSVSEMRKVNGGMLIGLWGLLAEGIKFLIGEVSDALSGLGNGFTYTAS